MKINTQLKDYFKEIKLFNNRIVVVLLASVLLLLILGARMYYLQISQNEHFKTLSKNNRVTIQPIPPTRGLIYDRNGVILAENISSFTLQVVPEKVDSINKVINQLKELIELSDAEIKRFRKLLSSSHHYTGIPLKFNLNQQEVAILASHRYQLNGVEVEAQLSRYYPYSEDTAHVVGYVGRINIKELKKLSENGNLANYNGTNYIGKLGIEKAYENHLHGTAGFQQVETNVRGRVLRILQRTDPIPGKDLYLNIDIKLHQVVREAFGEEKGSLVAIDPNNGNVLAIVSMPTYDANLFVNGISHNDYNDLNLSKARPLFNRSILGQYPPGSTSKPFIALAGLEVGTITDKDKIYCPGYYQLKDKEHKYRDWKKWGHGVTDVNKGIVQSCDVYFYDLAYHLGIDKMSEYMTYFGFGKKTGIDIPGERSGLMPSREWKRDAKGQAWFPGETLITGIGQGYMLATPVQLSSAIATLANNGHRFKPQLVKAINNVRANTELMDGGKKPDLNNTEKNLIIKNKVDKNRDINEIAKTKNMHRTEVEPENLNNIAIINKSNWDTTIQAMRDVVHSARGTARRLNKPGMNYDIAGKTGTAQVFTVAQDEEYKEKELAKELQDHALFIAFAPVDKPQIAVSVIVENGGHGGSVAAPIAGKLIEYYLSNR
ncbi:MAG: penicillin-binding protein 2 [Gammaproteobacteria bacterium]|nr:penicillin-binding protein 2 [Gammaproteobacteria bacterium]